MPLASNANDDLRPCVAGRLARSSSGEEPRTKYPQDGSAPTSDVWGTTWAIAALADSRAQLFGSSSRASWCRQHQTIAETRVPTVRGPSPKRRVAQPGLSRRIGAGQTMGDAILSRDR